MSMQIVKQDLVDRKFKSEKTQLKILAMLFKTCNGSCPFCFQREFHTQMPTSTEFKKHWKTTVNVIDEIMAKYADKFDEITISLMGGELFMNDPELDDVIFKMIKALSKYKIEIRITSNLLANDINAYKNAVLLIDSLGMTSNIHTSFDFGPLRFHTDSQLQTFKHNIIDMIDFAKTTNRKIVTEVIRTKYMLQQLKTENEFRSIFEMLTKNCDICLNQLVGNFDYALSYDESVELWKLLFERYPNITDLKTNFSVAGRNCLNVLRTVIVNNKVYYGCVAQKYSLHTVPVEWKKEHSKNFLNKYSCIMCKYFNQCPMKCPIERQYDKCDIKEVKDWLIKKNITI